MNRVLPPASLFFASLFAWQLSAQVPTIKSGGVVNGATFSSSAPLAPGLIFSVFGAGAGLTDGSRSRAGGNLPTRLAGARLLVSGVAAPLFFASPDQISAQFPVELAGLTSATLQVEVQTASGTVTSPEVTVPVAPFSPGIFTQDQNGSGPGSIFRTTDFSKICPPARFDCSANPAVPGEAVSIFMTGLGAVNGPWSSGQPAKSASPTVTAPQVTIGGVSAQVLFSGLATGSVGLYQVNVVVPVDAPMGDNVPLSLSIGGMASNQVTIAIGTTAYRQGGGPPGGSATAIAIDPQNHSTVYVGTGGGGVFKSTDGGQIWTAANKGLGSLNIRVLTMDPFHSGTLYAASFSGLSKSSDGGGSWSATNVPSAMDPSGHLLFPGIYALAVDPQNNLYAGTGFGVFKSTDGGLSWSAANNGLFRSPVFTIAIDPVNSSTLYAGTTASGSSNGIFKSIDGGANWTPVNHGLTVTDSSGRVFTPEVQTLVIAPSSPFTLYAGTGSGVFKSADGGANWTGVNNGLTSTFNGETFVASVTALAIDPMNPAIVYAGIFGGVSRTTDGGANWSAASAGITSSHVSAVAVDPVDSAKIFAAAVGGIFESPDRATTWRLTNRGLTSTSVRALAVSRSSPDTLYAGTDGFGVFRSGNGGTTWVAANIGPTGPASALVIDPSNPAIIYAGTDGTGNGSGGGGVFKSVDGGVNWSRLTNGLGPGMTGVRRLVIDPSNPAVLYVVTGGGFYKSTDGGASWAALRAGSLNGVFPQTLVVDPSDSDVVYAGTYGTALFKSTDGGASWTALKNAPMGFGGIGSSALAIDPNNPATLYTSPGLAGVVFKTTDGGETWIAANVGLPAAIISNITIDPANSATLYAATGAGIFKSTNGGGSWTGANSGLPYFVSVLAVSSTPDSTTLYAGTQGAGVFKSTDGGASWQPTGANQE